MKAIRAPTATGLPGKALFPTRVMLFLTTVTRLAGTPGWMENPNLYSGPTGFLWPFPFLSAAFTQVDFRYEPNSFRFGVFLFHF